MRKNLTRNVYLAWHARLGCGERTIVPATMINDLRFLEKCTSTCLKNKIVRWMWVLTQFLMTQRGKFRFGKLFSIWSSGMRLLSKMSSTWHLQLPCSPPYTTVDCFFDRWVICYGAAFLLQLRGCDGIRPDTHSREVENDKHILCGCHFRQGLLLRMSSCAVYHRMWRYP